MHVATDACPSAALINQQLEPLLGPDAQLTFDADELGRADAGHASVSDLGERYVVEINGLRRELDDAARDCEERARVATVYIALNLRDTPPPAPAPVAPPPAPPPPPPPPRADPWHVGLQVFGEADYAPQIDRAAPGAGAGVFVDYDAWRFDASLGVLAATDIALAQRASLQGSVALIRVPLVLSANVSARLGALRLGPTLGAELDLLHMRGRDVLRPQSELRLNPGALAALDAHLSMAAGLGLWLRLGASAFPRAYDLTVDPLGTLGQTPRWWLHARLGITWQFH